METYYLLDKKYRLCGWDESPHAVVDRERAYVRFVTPAAMDALLLCDGQVDLSLPLIPEHTRFLVREFEKKGVVHPCAPGEALEERQKYIRYPNRFIQSVHWSVTGRCNSRCKHCFMSAGEGKYGELSHEEIMKIVDDMAACGVPRCALSGGEPLVRPDFWEIVDALVEREIRISTIYTNGMLVNQAFLDGLIRRGIRPSIHMSYDGPGYHDWLRGVDGAEKAVRRALSECREAGFSTGVVMCVWKDNIHTLRDTVNEMAQAGCGFIKANLIAPEGAWKKGGYAERYSLTEEEALQAFYHYLDAFYEDLPGIEVILGNFFSADGRKPDQYRIPAVHFCRSLEQEKLCAHAKNDMYFSPEGRAMFCISFSSLNDEFQKQFPLVHKEGIAKCVTSSRYEALLNTSAVEVMEHNRKCHDCRWQRACLGGCRASALSCHEEDILSVDEYTCRMFREGWIEKIVNKVHQLRPGAHSMAQQILQDLAAGEQPDAAGSEEEERTQSI